MGANNLIHLDEEIIEQYAEGRLEGADLDNCEEHLLVCPYCQKRLTEADEFVRAVKLAGRRPQPESLWSRIGTIAIRPPMLAAAGAALVLLIAVPMWRKQPAETYQTVQLSSFRGQTAAAAKAGSRLDLNLEASGLEPTATFTVEVVDGGGKPVWEGPGHLKDGAVNARIDSSLDAGRYWVRLYGSSLKTELLREYPLALE